MGETADQLREEIAAKRQDASEKIEQLEQKVTGAADQIQGQVEHVREQVMETFDWRKQVDERPLLALGAAFIGGVVLSNVLGGSDHGSSGGRTSDNVVRYGESAGSSAGLAASIRHAAKSSGFEDTLSGLTSNLMSTLTEHIKTAADQLYPGMGEKLQAAAKQGTFGDKIAEGVSSSSSTSGGSGSNSDMTSTGPASATTSTSTTGEYARAGEFGSSVSSPS